MKIKAIEKIAAPFHQTARAAGLGLGGWTPVLGAAQADADRSNPAPKLAPVPIGSDPESIRRLSGNKKRNVGVSPMAGSGASALNGVPVKEIWTPKPCGIR